MSPPPRLTRLMAVATGAAVTAALAGLTPGAAAEPSDASVTAGVALGDFETGTTPWFVATGGSATGTVTRTTDDARSGAASARLDVQMPDGIVELVRGVPSIDAERLRFSLRSTDLTAIVVRAIEAGGEAHQQRLDLDPANGAWQDLTVADLGGGTEHITWGGDGDGVWQGPLTQVSVLVDHFRLTDGPTGTLLIDDVAVDLAAGTAPTLAIEPVAVGNAFDAGQPVRIGFSTTAEQLSWTVRDAYGTPVESGAAAVADLGGELPLDVTDVGWYAVDLVATGADGVVTTGGTDLSILDPFDPGATTDRRIGVSTHYGQAWDPVTIPLVARAGFSSARDEAYWAQQERTPGVFDWTPKVEAYADAFEANGVDFFNILAYGNPLYHEGEAPATQQGWDAYARYALASMERFGTDDTIYELWNEWNWRDLTGPAGGSAANYFGLVRTTSEAVRAEHPDAYLVAGALAPMNDWQAWVQEFVDLGGLDHVDAFSTHPYVYPGEPEGFIAHLETLRSIFAAAGHPDMPILMSEHGWPTGTSPRAVSETVQARNLTRSQLLAIANGVERYTTYDFKDDGTDSDEVEHRFGIIRNEADERGAYTPKPAYVANAILTRTIAGKPFLREETPATGVHDVVLDAGSGDELHAAWTSSGAQAGALAFTATGDVTVTDLYGAEHVLSPGTDGAVHVSVGPEPVYVSGPITGVGVSTTYTLEASGGAVGAPVPAHWTVDNSDGRRVLNVRLETGGETVRARVKPHEQAGLDLRLPAAAMPGERVWSATVRSGSADVAYLTARADVVDAIALTGAHAELADGADVLRVRATNNADVPVELAAVQVDVAGEHTSGLEGTVVEPGEVASLDVPVTLTEATPWTATAVATTTATTSGTLLPVPEVHDVPAASVVVDGAVDAAVAALPPVQLAGDAQRVIDGWGGDADLSGRLWLTHDDDALYLTAAITDDVHAQPGRGPDIWAGDGFQLGAAAGVPGEDAVVQEVGAALTDAGAVDVARWLPTDVAPDTTGIRAAVTRDDAAGTTVYELSVSWDALGVHPEDRLLGLTAVLNENDGTGRRGWYTWGAGVAETKDGALFTALRLTDG
ncbi:sugar-binding protein [Jiangella endophytica]|uniref:sugar-binding protein n=1 Tax=Jiangella endophytica TaxID=1623398 RepID=UPI0013003D85|nr:sugar-binding protein [Jiangella endophytica]